MDSHLETETVDIKVTLDSNWHNEPPKFAVLIDNELVENGVVFEKSDDNQEKIISFSKELTEGEHILQIRLLDKKNIHTKVNENNEIIADQLLNIKQIEIDEIELDYLFYNLGKYYKQMNDNIDFPFYEAEPLPDSYKNLGWNGEWCLTFSVPTYIWFLENL
jgi:hypothetical protein